jgi:hypothetical protein
LTPTSSVSKSWAQAIESRLSPPGIFKLVYDPANFTAAPVQARLQSNGWHCLNAATPLDLRHHYESICRQGIPSGQPTMVRLNFGRERIPYDIAAQFDLVDLSPAAIFPSLAPEPLTGLPSKWYAILYKNQPANPAQQTAEQTARYILNICLGVTLPAAPAPADILHLLVQLVRQRVKLPSGFQAWVLPGNISASLRHAFSGLPRAQEFLQTIWLAYASTLAAPGQLAEQAIAPELIEWAGIIESDPQSQHIFTELCRAGKLPPIQLAPDHAPLPAWLQADLHYRVDVTGYLAQTLEQLTGEIPTARVNLNGWGEFAQRWAAWRVQYRQYRQQAQAIQSQYAATCKKLSANFYVWLQKAYYTHLRYPYLPKPSCVHQVLPYLVSQHAPSPHKPLAVVVVDGMAWEDWLILESLLKAALPGIAPTTLPILALLPTLTSISRQALLSAKLPRQFTEHWQTTNAEEALWITFWQSHGLQPAEIGYIRGLGKPGSDSIAAEVLPIIARPDLAVAAFIVNGIDDLIHASTLQDFTFQNEVLAWAKKCGFAEFIQTLRQRFAAVVITTDHGHITGQGVGRPPFEHLAIEGSLRVGLFQAPLDDSALRQLFSGIPWQDHDMPTDILAVFPPGNGIFAPTGEERITHGGPSLEETVIPLVIIATEE